MQTEIAPVTSVTKTPSKGPIKVDRIYKSDFQKEGTISVQLRQVVKTLSSYPAVQPKTGGLFSPDEFQISAKEFTSEETRIAFLDVPEGTALAEINKRLAALPNKAIVKVLSNHPILSENQKNGIRAELATMDTFANSQVVRYPEGHEKEGELILDKSGKIQYKVNNFMADTDQDVVDYRTADTSDYYASEELMQELAAVGGVGAGSGQGL